jgi:hypothetical protein
LPTGDNGAGHAGKVTVPEPTESLTGLALPVSGDAGARQRPVLTLVKISDKTVKVWRTATSHRGALNGELELRRGVGSGSSLGCAVMADRSAAANSQSVSA